MQASLASLSASRYEAGRVYSSPLLTISVERQYSNMTLMSNTAKAFATFRDDATATLALSPPKTLPLPHLIRRQQQNRLLHSQRKHPAKPKSLDVTRGMGVWHVADCAHQRYIALASAFSPICGLLRGRLYLVHRPSNGFGDRCIAFLFHFYLSGVSSCLILHLTLYRSLFTLVGELLVARQECRGDRISGSRAKKTAVSVGREKGYLREPCERWRAQVAFEARSWALA